MGLEIERKFLLANGDWRKQVQRSQRLCQGYLAADARASVRVRIAGQQATLNIKAAIAGAARAEYEYPLPLEDAQSLLATLCRQPLLEKTRHFLPQGDHIWEIDEFHGDNDGLIVAEIELRSVDETFARPPWLGREVTDELAYYNSQLASHPYKRWGTTHD